MSVGEQWRKKGFWQVHRRLSNFKCPIWELGDGSLKPEKHSVAQAELWSWWQDTNYGDWTLSWVNSPRSVNFQDNLDHLRLLREANFCLHLYFSQPSFFFGGHLFADNFLLLFSDLAAPFEQVSLARRDLLIGPTI